MAKAMEDGKLRLPTSPKSLNHWWNLTLATIPDDWPHVKFNFNRRRGWSGRIPVRFLYL